MSLAFKNAFVIISLAIISFATIYVVSPSLQNLSPIALFDEPVLSLANLSIDNVLVSLSLRNSSSITPLNDPTHTEAKKHSTENDFYRHLINRHSNFSSWFSSNNKTLRDQADKDGPILDFMIAGFPKCGTTTVVANLAQIAPMPQKDVCGEQISQIVNLSYNVWPDEFNGTDKLYRGVKCPQMVHRKKMLPTLPKVKLIIGIRHPVLWFQSFWNMQAVNDWRSYVDYSPYNRTSPCTGEKGEKCNNGCPNQLYCIFRARFHLHLAYFGKTPLTRKERMLLAPNDQDGGKNIQIQRKVKNPVFLYEMNQLEEDYLWEDLSQFLNYPNGTIPHDRYRSSHGNKRIEKKIGDKINYLDVCEPQYDRFRAIMMPYAYEMSQWICDYFVPYNKRQNKVMVPRRDKFCEIVRGYKNDPCGRLIRTQNGTYIVDVENVQIESNVTTPKRKTRKGNRVRRGKI